MQIATLMPRMAALAACALLLAAAFSGGAMAAQDVPVPNGSFEDWNDATGLPTAWACTSNDGAKAFQKDTTIVADGKASLKIVSGNATYVSLDVPTIPNTEYQVTLKIRGENCSGVRLHIERNLVDGQPREGTFDWVTETVRFNCVADRVMNINFRFRGEGTVWIDDCRVKMLSEPGAAVTEEYKRLMERITWRDKIVDESKREDRSWMKPYKATDAGAVASAVRAWKKTTPRPWAVGQWVRYEVDDQVMIPSGKLEKRPETSVIQCAIVGKEKVGGKTYWWYEMLQHKPFWWYAEQDGRTETGRKLLVAQPRSLTVKMLVDGPAFRDIARYIVKINDEQPLDYRTGGKAFPPYNDCIKDMIRPCPGAKPTGSSRIATDLGAFQGPVVTRDRVSGILVAGIPVTALASAEMTSRCLDRKAKVMACGLTGAKTSITETPKVLDCRTDAFVSGGDGENMLGSGPLLGEERKKLATPILIYGAPSWTVDLLDMWRSNFIGALFYLDEPYERQHDFRSTFSPDGLKTPEEAANAYVSAVKGMVESSAYWNGAWVGSCDAGPMIAWYNIKAGCRTFWLEDYYYNMTNDLYREFVGVDFDNTQQELWDRWAYAPVRGAARVFGAEWGVGVHYPPPRVKRNSDWAQANSDHFLKKLTDAYDMGAKLLVVYTEDPTGYEEGKHLPKLLWNYIDSRKGAKRPPITDVVVLPRGSLIDWRDGRAGTLWTAIPFDDNIKRLYKEYVRVTTELIRAGREFDVVIDDPAVDLSLYQRVHRIAVRRE